MDVLSRWRADLARPEAPTGRDHLPFLAGSAVVIVALAQLTDPGTGGELLLVGVCVVAFVVRGLVAVPAEVFAVAVLVPVVLAIGGEGNLEGAFFLTVMATLYTSWHLGSTVRAVVIAGAAVATAPLVAQHLVASADIGWTPWAAANVFTFSMGRVLRRQEELIEQLEAAREALAEQAVAEERRRIARELHDLAGHTLAAVLLHVTGARHVLRRDLDEAERALLDAETVGRASLDQIRVTVAALRTDERGTDPSLAGSADLVPLVEEYRRAGLAIDATIAPGLEGIDGPTGTALHRITRESLANVARHAPGNEVIVTVDRSGGDLHLAVADRGQAADPAATGSGHFGIIGMRERARALGGDLEAGPTADGWRVEAHLPAAPAAGPQVVP